MLTRGFWLEQPQTGRDEAFAAALGRGLLRLADFLQARRVEVAAIEPAGLRRLVQHALQSDLDQDQGGSPRQHGR